MWLKQTACAMEEPGDNRAWGVRNGCRKQGDAQFDLASTSNNTCETSEALLPHFPSLSHSHLD